MPRGITFDCGRLLEITALLPGSLIIFTLDLTCNDSGAPNDGFLQTRTQSLFMCFGGEKIWVSS